MDRSSQCRLCRKSTTSPTISLTHSFSLQGINIISFLKINLICFIFISLYFLLSKIVFKVEATRDFRYRTSRGELDWEGETRGISSSAVQNIINLTSFRDIFKGGDPEHNCNNVFSQSRRRRHRKKGIRESSTRARSRT